MPVSSPVPLGCCPKVCFTLIFHYYTHNDCRIHNPSRKIPTTFWGACCKAHAMQCKITHLHLFNPCIYLITALFSAIRFIVLLHIVEISCLIIRKSGFPLQLTVACPPALRQISALQCFPYCTPRF